MATTAGRISSSTDGIEHTSKTPTIMYNTTTAQLGHVPSSPNGINIPPELFEKLYLQPKIPQYSRFANPTPMGLVGFVISTFTFSTILMSLPGTSTLPAVIGIFFFVGPLLLTLSAIFNWIMGNFYPMMATSLFAVFWLSFGMLQLPSLGLADAYSTSSSSSSSSPSSSTTTTGGGNNDGSTTPGYNNVIGLYLIIWGFAFLTFLLFALKTNAVFAGIFGLSAVAVWVLAAAYVKTGAGDYVAATALQKTGGALLFVVSILGWWIVVAMMAAEMRVCNVPVGDLSCYWPDAKEAVAAAKEDVEKQA